MLNATPFFPESSFFDLFSHPQKTEFILILWLDMINFHIPIFRKGVGGTDFKP